MDGFELTEVDEFNALDVTHHTNVKPNGSPIWPVPWAALSAPVPKTTAPGPDPKNAQHQHVPHTVGHAAP